MCSKKQKGYYTTAQKMIRRLAFELPATCLKKKRKKKGETQTRVEPVPLRIGSKALNKQLHVHSRGGPTSSGQVESQVDN